MSARNVPSDAETSGAFGKSDSLNIFASKELKNAINAHRLSVPQNPVLR